jgi:two-component system phosphate regulon sensor histidine kinase PhoR
MERDTLRRFISNASHELRTPITALKNFNELLQGKARNDEKAREQFLIESSSQLDRLEWITQNLLNLSRLDGGLTQPQLDAFEANSVINSAIAAHEAQANEKSIDLQNATPESDIEVIGDKMLLQLALSNLVDNAIKFTQRNGQIKLGVGRTKENIRFWIRDNGDGIDPEELPNIFDRFYRGRNAETEGSGLGLAMVDSVVKALGGTIEVESELGAGSHFVIELPNQMQ